MAATVMGRHTRDMSSDTAQDYPGRPIRPLPRRRLRERLSLEAAGKIVYPPLTSMIKPTFFHPFTTAQEDERPQRQHPTDRARQDEIEHNYISRRNVKDVDSDDDYTELAYRSRYSRHSPDSSGRSYRYVQKPETRNNKPAPPASTTSSADGYDSFENTNNKKKRKIPTPGDAISNGILLQNDLVSLGISTPPNESPLREGDGNRAAQQPGIISAAISNAENYGKEHRKLGDNRSLLEAVASRNPNPAAAQFTFTCDSQVPGSVPWPARPLPSTQGMGQPLSKPARETQGTQTSPKANVVDPLQRRRGSSSSQQTPKPNRKPSAPKKNRRQTGREYLIAARQRREQQQLENLRHPPSPEDQWICEFCEYESIFGTPPMALIRQYEMKDRRIRKQEAERRRLLEKAKMKGRKSKRNTKASAATKTATTTNAATCHDQTRPGQGSAATRSDAHTEPKEPYYEDGEVEEEEYINDHRLPTPMPPLSTPAQLGSHTSKPGAVQGGAGRLEALGS